MTQEELEKLHPEDLLILKGNSCWRGTICTFKGLSSRKGYCRVTLYEQIEKEFHRKNLSKAPTVIPVFVPTKPILQGRWSTKTPCKLIP